MVQEAAQRKEAELLLSGDLWDQLISLVNGLEQFFLSWPEAHVLAYECFEHRGNLLCSLRAIKRGLRATAARSANAFDPLFLPLLIRLLYKGSLNSALILCVYECVLALRIVLVLQYLFCRQCRVFTFVLYEII